VAYCCIAWLYPRHMTYCDKAVIPWHIEVGTGQGERREEREREDGKCRGIAVVKCLSIYCFEAGMSLT